MTAVYEVWEKSDGRTATIYRSGNEYWLVATEHGEKYKVIGQPLNAYRSDLRHSGYHRTQW